MNDNIIRKKIIERENHTWWKESEKKVAERYGQIFNSQNISNLSKEEFKSFLLIKNNLHWAGIQRWSNKITSDMSLLKRSLELLLDESQPIQKRLTALFNKKSEYSIRGLGKAVITPILLVAYPDKYGVWNKRSETALKKVEFFPKFQSGESYVDKYLKINAVIKNLALKYNIRLWQLDGIFGEISGFSPFESDKSGYGNFKNTHSDEDNIRKEIN